MELHRRTSCVLPSNAPALPDSSLSDYTVPSRVLQERSGNRQHGFGEDSTSWKREATSPSTGRYPHGLRGSYFAGNVAAQLHSEKSEKQIERETERLWNLLQRCDKYIKYRDRQPQQNQKGKDKEQPWPSNLEYAFFKGLVRWPPMGRQQRMLDGHLRGRNELVADSIMKDTGIERTRKQVSSHIQVLKNKLSDQPQIMVYMSTENKGSRRNRHGMDQSASNSSKYDYTATTSSYTPGYALPSTRSIGNKQSHAGAERNAPFIVAEFGMVVMDNTNKPVHCLTQLADRPRLGDINITDTTSWNKQYPEFSFHRTNEWTQRHVLICDASIDLEKMTQKQPNDSRLAIPFAVDANVDLSKFDALECRTRFYDNGKIADQPEKRDGSTQESREECQYETEMAGHHDASGSRFWVRFGSRFWVYRMMKLGQKLKTARMREDHCLRSKEESELRRDLQYLTAVQDIYGTERTTEQSECFLTILWRFHRTKSSQEAGRMTWRVANFGPRNEQQWARSEDVEMKHAKDTIAASSMSATTLYPALPLAYPQQPFPQHSPHLSIDNLYTIPSDVIEDYSNPASATAPSLSTDYSQASLSSLAHSHSQDNPMSQSHEYHDANDIDFTGGHIHISLEPAINLGAYETYNHAPSPAALNSIPTLEHTHDVAYAALGLALPINGCYPTKPWPYTDLVARLEGAAEHHMLQSAQSHGGDMAGHGVLHGGEPGALPWKLQSAFPEDTGVGADARVKGEGLQHERGLSIVDLMERGRRESGEFAGF